MFEYLNWAVQLEGVSPVARLLAIWMADHLTYISSSIAPSPDEPVCEIDIDAALIWIGCDESELLLATGELIRQGVSPLNVVGRKLHYTFPDLVTHDVKVLDKAVDSSLSIYVISAGADVSKIGVSKFPDYRLHNLQAANPLQVLSLAWSAAGQSKVIRKAEREAHRRLDNYAMGREWFNVEASRAIAVVKSILEGSPTK